MSEKLLLPAEIINVYEKLGQKPITILKNYAVDMVTAKIQKYEAESKKFAEQYQCTYSQLKKKIESMKESEEFQLEDDFLDWQFAERNLKFWKQVLKNLKSA